MRQYALLFLAFFANYFVNGMFHDVTLIPMINMVLYFLAGAVVAIRQDFGQNASDRNYHVADRAERLAVATA